ncbi:MAG: iron ABC transporter permease [Chloroflexota bacterium]|nr:iron ABC transporter permease [Chloroflexota bacterium]MDE3192184.1 iron ABC transporter permease [Chloroflexota bacterium]
MLGVLAAALVVSLGVGILVGAVAIGPGDVVAALAGGGDRATGTIVRELRLPRVIAAALVGAALAVAGVLLQGLTRNPLADPYVTGSSAGAALGAVIAIAFLGPLAGAVVPLAAFAGALAAVAVVWQLARLGGRTTVLTILLAGIVMTAFAGAAVTLLLVASDRLSLRLRAVLDVLVGAVNIGSPGELTVAAAIVVLGIALALVVGPRIDAYAFGEETAATLGVDTDRVTIVVLASAALLAGAAVALAGLVGFVGLVVPHAVRAVVGAGHRPLVAASALAGAVVLVLADAGARVALAPAELPVGVITGLIGAPFFILLLVRSRRMILV